MESPCIKKCKIKGKFCIGCKRTIEEIIKWTQYTSKQRRNIMKDVMKR